MTVSISDGIAPMRLVRKVMLEKSEPRISAIQIKVMPAFRLRGSLKAVMPLEIASTPVRAAVPLEKACKIRNGVIATRTPWPSMCGGSTTCPNVPERVRASPVATVANIITMKK